MSLRRAFHEIFSSGLYGEQEQYVQIRPFESFGPVTAAKTTRRAVKLAAAKAILGDRWCLRNPSPPKEL